MRAIFLSLLLIVIMIFRPEGLVGRREFSWGWLLGERPAEPTDEERRQDAWLSNAQLNRSEEDPQASEAEVLAARQAALPASALLGGANEADGLADDGAPDDSAPDTKGGR